MVETLVTAALGGGTGVFGSLIGRVAGIFEQKQRTKQLEIELAHEYRLQELQSTMARFEQESEEAIAFDGNATAALIGSYEHDASYLTSYLRWVRPVLTLLLIIASMVIYGTLNDEIAKNDIAKQIVFSCSMAISWWFADRSGKNRRG